MEANTHKTSVGATWMVIFLLLLMVLAKGMLSFFVVGDLGQPTWDYRPVMDVPGESPYAIYQPMPYPQHVEGDKSEITPLTEGWDSSLYPSPRQLAIGE